MQKVMCTTSYDGSDFHGFSRQPRLRTVQGEIERVLSVVFDCPIETIAASRTDAGVHARAQVFHFTLPHQRVAVEKLPYICSRQLPDDIVLEKAVVVDDGFDARRSVLWKTYRYTIALGPIQDVFIRRYALYEHQMLDVDAMQAAALHLMGEHDFTSFCTARAQQVSKVRTVHRIHFAYDHQARRLHIDITGNGFLHNMVRIIVGTLLNVGRGKLKSIDVLHILESRDRRTAGQTAPARGLTLWHIEYPCINLLLDDA